MIYCYLLPIVVALVANIIPALSQAFPCPPYPELAVVVDTPEKCNCFYALAGSGFDAADDSTYDTVLNDDSVQNVVHTGQYLGADGIAEYLSIVDGTFIHGWIAVGQELVLDMTGTTNEQCVATTAVRRRMPLNPLFTKDETEICVELTTGAVLYYTMTGNLAAPITIQKMNTWFPDELISVVFPLFDVTKSAEMVCDTIVNICGYDESNRRLKMKVAKKNNIKKSATAVSTKDVKKEKSTKAAKRFKQSNNIKECLERYQSLPLTEKIGNLTYIDGNTQGCRMLHAQFAEKNPEHCPHISFEADEDINGLVKCNESKEAPFTDIFTDQQLALFNYATILLDLGPTASQFDIKYEACPTELS